MANILAVRTEVPGGHRFVWETMTSADTALGVKIPAAADVSIQVTGDFGTDALVTIEGSLEVGTEVSVSGGGGPTNWSALDDPIGDPISIGSLAVGLVTILQNSIWYRPVVSAGTAEDLDVIMYARTTR